MTTKALRAQFENKENAAVAAAAMAPWIKPTRQLSLAIPSENVPPRAPASPNVLRNSTNSELGLARLKSMDVNGNVYVKDEAMVLKHKLSRRRSKSGLSMSMDFEGNNVVGDDVTSVPAEEPADANKDKELVELRESKKTLEVQLAEAVVIKSSLEEKIRELEFELLYLQEEKKSAESERDTQAARAAEIQSRHDIERGLREKTVAHMRRLETELTLAKNHLEVLFTKQESAYPLLPLLDSNVADAQKAGAKLVLALVSAENEAQVAEAKEKAIVPLVTTLKKGSEKAKECAAYALGQLAAERDENKSTINSAGAIMALISVLKSSGPAAKAAAGAALQTLSHGCNDNKTSIAINGGLGPLVQLMDSGTVEGKLAAVSVLRNIATMDRWREAIVKKGAIPALVSMLHSTSEAHRTVACECVTNLSYMCFENQGEFARANAIQPLVGLLAVGSDDTREAACQALRNLTLAPENTALIAAFGGIPAMVDLLEHGPDSTKAVAASALCSLAVNNDNKVSIANAGAIPAFIDQVDHGVNSGRKAAALALRNLAGNADIRLELIGSRAVEALASLREEGDADEARAAKGALEALGVHLVLE
eukprot:jgi/Chlat1/1017/Chrsp109S01446